MEVGCGRNPAYPTALLNKCRAIPDGCLPWRKRYPSETEIQALAHICSLDNRLVCLKNLSSHLFSPLECLLGWLLPFLAQQARSWKRRSSKVSKLLLMTVMGGKRRSRRGRDHGEETAQHSFQNIRVYTHTEDNAYTRKRANSHVFPLSFVGNKVLHCPPAKNRARFPVVAVDNVRKHQESCIR